MGVFCKAACAAVTLVVLTGIGLFLVAIRHSGTPEVEPTKEVEALKDEMRAVRTALGKYVHFNHAPPLKSNPFLAPPKQVQPGKTCAFHFFEDTKVQYQLVTVDESELASNSSLVRNHEGECGPCSSLDDFVVMSWIQHKIVPKLRAYDYWFCAAVSMVSRDWGVECFRNAAFTTPCAELLHWRSVAATKNCFSSCWSSEILEDCMQQCDDEKYTATFEAYAGRHFRTNNNMHQFNKTLPKIDEAKATKLAAWRPPTYDAAFVADLKTKELVNPPAVPTTDPYTDASVSHWVDPAAVCAVKFEGSDNRRYSLKTHPSEAQAVASGAKVTHHGECGLCSSLQDLAVYVATPDLTTPVRRCSIKSFFSESWARECLYDLGFSEPCASIWLANAQNTRKKCLTTCLYYINAPNNNYDGSLTPCIRCDEEVSGPIFKKLSARTRRNSGLFSAILRPGPAVAHIVHDYPKTKPAAEGGDTQAAAGSTKDEL